MDVYVIYNARNEMVEICRDIRSALEWFYLNCDCEFTIREDGENSIITPARGEEYRLVEWHTYS